MVSSSEDFERVRAATPGVYQRRAARFAAERDSSLKYEREALERFTAALPPGGRVLDLGCGTGTPVSAYLLDHGFAVTGLDAAPAMLAIAREELPEGRWVLGDIRDLDGVAALAGETFDGVLSWHGSFHLTRDEQRAALPAICARVRQGGALMLTAGPEDGEVTGTVGGETVYHAILAPDEYDRILHGQGFAEVSMFEAAGGATVLLATGRSGGAGAEPA